MPLAWLAALFALVVGTGTVVWFRIGYKERDRDEYLRDVAAGLRDQGVECLGYGLYQVDGRVVKVEAGTNPLFGGGFSVRLGAYCDTVHEFELKRGTPVPAERAAFAPLLEHWSSAGKMHLECYAAGVTTEVAVLEDLRRLAKLSVLPLTRPCRGKTFTFREGFEPKVPQWHWRHDQRPRLPQGANRCCVSYWHGDAYLNEGLMRLFETLAGGARKFYLSDAKDLSSVEHAFGRRGISVHGMLVELPHAAAAIGADRFLDGEFFGGLFAAEALPPGFEEVPRYRFHDRAIDALKHVRFYARRLYDEECSWFSGEYEIVSVEPLDVRGALARVAAEFGAQVLEIDRRFHKRIVVPLEF